MKRHWKWIGIIILILLVAGAALYGWQRRTHDQQDVMQERGHGPTAMVGRGDIRRTLTVFGAVIPKDEIAFTFNINELLELKAEEGGYSRERTDPGGIKQRTARVDAVAG